MILRKAATGIAGFDEASQGGLPLMRTSLIEGGTGSGKTVFMLQCLVHGPRARGETCVFVAFEESPERIRQNLQSFAWDADALSPDGLVFIDARLSPDQMPAGEFDIAGLLAVLEYEAVAQGATTIVFDALDRLLSLTDDPRLRMREMARLQQWLQQRDLTAMISAKCHDAGATAAIWSSFDYLQFMLDCVITLDHCVQHGISQRTLRIRKYRGSGFEENAIPFVIGHRGLEVASVARSEEAVKERLVAERLSSGVADLDTMLQGGFFRASSVLLTGAPGTAKTTLCGAFAAAACARGENTLFISFDSHADEIVRNLRSVGIDLQPHRESGRLTMVSMRALQGSAESQLIAMRRLAEESDVQVLIADPLSALSKSGNAPLAPSVAERLIDWAKSRDVTVMCTSLLEDSSDMSEATPLQISTIADSWLHLTYVISAGERNRGLSIIKSRGTAHSNQVRELLLSDTGVRLQDVYSASGEVLMGAMRWEREREESSIARERVAIAERERSRLNDEAAELRAQLQLIEVRLAAKQRQMEGALKQEDLRADEDRLRQSDMRDLRLGGRGVAEGRNNG